MPEQVNEAVANKRLVLGFDAGCMTCSELARRIEDQVSDKLEVRSLHDPQMVHWRKQTLGESALWSPTLIQIDGAKVKGWTGVKMGIVLSRRIGISATWKIMQALGGQIVLQTRS